MPRTVFSIKAQIRDHAITIPAPENTLHHGIPNACNSCHKDRDANWALEHMNAWYKPASRQKIIRRADAFASARTGESDAVPKLLAILSDPKEGGLVRANAVGYLGNFQSDPAVFRTILAALADSEAPVRVIAARVLSTDPAHRSESGPALAGLLNDPAATVRLSAAVGLIGMGLRDPPGELVEPFERAKQLFRARASLNSDDAGQDVAAGRFYLLLADPASAIAALQTGLKLDPVIPAEYLLGAAYVEESNLTAAKQILESIPAGNEQYEKAQRLLKAIAERAAGRK